MERRLGLLMASLLMTVSATGCSIAMALNGHAEPNFDNIKVGGTREQVEFEFGSPMSTVQKENGAYEITYKYEMGNSTNPARASIYALYDFYTIGLAEPVFTLIELFQGHNEQTQVLYGSDHRVVEITGYLPPPPSAELKTATAEQDKWIRKPPKPSSDGGQLSQARSGE